ncbi:MAG TPA: hypothetical protein VEA41_09285 [Salinarimonas sp.]|nr:hypothetical protein [Salinarimonas sp.]
MERIYLEPDQYYCRIPRDAALGEIVLCAGFKFERVDEDQVELVLLSEADVERLTAPEVSA